jgi:RsiW-degrading membrane proteinase PrsW (M82 family)
VAAEPADGTLLAVVITDDWVGEGAREQFPSSVFYALLIGLREEVVKLLFFLPLVPYLARMGSETQALALAALVGLGFAMQENANYFLMGGGGGEIIGRYITANFAHQALTGFAGYHLVRAVRRGGEEWGEFFRVLVVVIVVHGGYDLFLIDPMLGDYSILSMVIFIVLAQRFLRLAFRLRPHRPQRVSLTRIFVAALATVTGMNYLYLSTRLGIGEALWETLGGLLGVALLTFLYFQEFDERVA